MHFSPGKVLGVFFLCIMALITVCLQLRGGNKYLLSSRRSALAAQSVLRGPAARHHGSLSGMQGLGHHLRSAFDGIVAPGMHVEAGRAVWT